MKDIILNYGCPRTGTTFVNQMLKECKEYITGKIAEGHSCHPIRSNHGLLDLGYTFQNYNIIFVRTTRNPINIFESFCHAKSQRIPVLGDQSISDIKQMIKSEEINTNVQISKNVKIITANFDRFNDPHYVKHLLNDISTTTQLGINADKMFDFVISKYNKLPIRQGRLSDCKVTHQYLSEIERLDIMQWHATIKGISG